MSVAAVVNNLLAQFGLQMVRSSTLAQLISAANQPAPEPTQPEPTQPEPTQSTVEAVEDILQEIYSTQLDVSPALITMFKDMRVTAQIAAGQSSAAWIANHADKVNTYPTRHDMLEELCKGELPAGGLAEFGVFTGAVTRFLRPRFPTRTYHAFDSFEGVPESMGLAIKAGDFALGGTIPELPDGVTTHIGWFEDTVPVFRQQYTDRLAFVYIDCDLFESVKTVLANLHDLLAPGAIVAFDDWYNFPNWQAHSRRALEELVERTGTKFTPIGLTFREHAVAFRYDGIAAS
jgi:hypothetical protein